MASAVRYKSHSKAQRNRPPPRPLKRKRDAEDIDALQRQVDVFEEGDEGNTEFTNLPLSVPTQSGLKVSTFKELTPIQSQAIPSALHGSDILGAARTGSGKTLAFLIPVLENLYRKRWTEHDGLGALILSPTRELAIQIFEVLRKIGRNHTFSAGLVIGGKSLQEERERLGRMNILVATPGRMLQHMDQTAEFEVGNLQMLVLDEADRIMDMGFKKTVDAIVEHLPPAGDRQTMLFSATQTKRVGDLARLSLKDPAYISVNEAGSKGVSATPEKLQQNYVVTPLPDKLDTLWSFIRANLKSKTLVFLSSGKQVRFVYESFRHLQPGIPLLHLHGRQKQSARIDITTRFSRSQIAVLFATDVAARGLDFPAVDWVVQVDCPEDVDTYIHRVGRTARYQRDGKAVLMLDPSEEEGMLTALEAKKIALEKINVRQKKQTSIRSQLQNMCFKDPELKYLGQKAFVSYVRSIHIQKLKDIFKVKNLALDDYAASMGLPGTPRVKFVKGEDAKERKNRSRQIAESDSDDGPERVKETPVVRTKYDRMFERTNQDVLADHYTRLIDEETVPSADATELATMDRDEVDDFLSIKRRFDAGDTGLDEGEYSPSLELNQEHEQDSEEKLSTAQSKVNRQNDHIKPQSKKRIQLSDKADDALIIDSNRRAKLLKSKKALLKFKGHGAHMHFDDEGVGHEAEYYEREEEFKIKGAADQQREKFVAEERALMTGIDEADKEAARDKRREKKIRSKEKEKSADSGPRTAVLNPSNESIGINLDTLGYGNENDGTEDAADDADIPMARKERKWFQDTSSDENEGASRGRKKANKGKGRNARSGEDEEGPRTVEDLEAMALGMIRK